MNKDKARALLKAHDMRATAPRLAVLMLLAQVDRPLSHSEVLEQLGQTDWDQATVYRNLVKLKQAGVAVVASQAGGIDRYTLSSPEDDGHRHPHFVCESCGKMACLPTKLTSSMHMDGPWAASVQQAMVQLRGACPECIEQH